MVKLSSVSVLIIITLPVLAATGALAGQHGQNTDKVPQQGSAQNEQLPLTCQHHRICKHGSADCTVETVCSR
jgi:hypothetical protein